MRIVEIGSGSGGTSAVVLDALAGLGARVDFVYTDLSPQLVAYGRRTFEKRYAFARFHTLDIERDLPAQVGCHPPRSHFRARIPRAKLNSIMRHSPAEGPTTLACA